MTYPHTRHACHYLAVDLKRCRAEGLLPVAGAPRKDHVYGRDDTIDDVREYRWEGCRAV